MTLHSNIKGISLSLSELYTGFKNSLCHRWLPVLTYGSLPSDSPCFLLTSPPVFSFDNINAFFCTHVSAPSWHAYLTHTWPWLAWLPVPLFSRPMFPNPWQPHLQSPTNTIKTNNKHDKWTTGEEAIVAIVSWVGWVLLTEFIGPNQSLKLIDVCEVIEIYHDACSNIIHMIDSILCGIIAHGIFRPSISLTHAAKFISSSLECIAETAKHCTICCGSEISQSNVNATSWLPTVLFSLCDIDVKDMNLRLYRRLMTNSKMLHCRQYRKLTAPSTYLPLDDLLFPCVFPFLTACLSLLVCLSFSFFCDLSSLGSPYFVFHLSLWPPTCLVHPHSQKFSMTWHLFFFTFTPHLPCTCPSPTSTHSYTLGTSIPALPSIPRYLTNLVIGVHNTFHRNQKKITHINMANCWGSGITEPLDNRYLGFRVGIAKTCNPTQQCTKLLTGRQLKSWLGYTINKCSIAYKTLGFKEINMFRP